MPYSTAFLFRTGRDPGSPRQTGQVWVLGSELWYAVEHPQKSLDWSLFSWTWISRPMMTSFSILDHLRPLLVEGRGSLEGVGSSKHCGLIEVLAYELQTYR